MAINLFTPRDLGVRPWGTELLVAETADYIGKVLSMREGTSGPKQSHRRKDESFYVFKGSVRLTSLDDYEHVVAHILTPGMAVRIPPGTVHQVEALEDSVLFETSTPHFDDRVPAA